MDECMDRWINEQMKTYGWINGWMDGRIDE